MKTREYFGVPKWFVKQMKDTGNGSLLNVLGARHYIGFGFDVKKKTWTNGVFLSGLEMGLPFWKREAEEADFIIHFGEAV
jgi:hypothetical protein